MEENDVPNNVAELPVVCHVETTWNAGDPLQDNSNGSETCVDSENQGHAGSDLNDVGKQQTQATVNALPVTADRAAQCLRGTPAKRKSPAKLTDTVRLAMIKMDEEMEGEMKKYKRIEIAQLFGVDRGTVTKVVQMKENISYHGASGVVRHRPGLLGEDVEQAIVQRIVDVNHNGSVVTAPQIENWAQELVSNNHPDFKASRGWREGLMRRHKLQYLILHGEGGSVPEHVVAAGRSEMHHLTRGWPLEDVYNADETGLYFQILGSRSITQGARAGVKLSKARMTVMVCANATGTTKLPLFAINKFETPKSLRGLDKSHLPVQWRSNRSAWMTRDLFTEWLMRWDATLDRPILLLVDNCSAHKVTEETLNGLQHVTLKFLPKNTTSHLQPLDQGVISAFKRHYRTGLVKWFVDVLGGRQDSECNGVTLVPRENQSALVIEEYSAIKLMAAAWNSISATAIAKCWQKAAIVPDKTDEHFLVHSDVNHSVDGEITDGEDDVVSAFTTLRSHSGSLPQNLREVVEDTGADTLEIALSAVPGEQEVIEVPPDQDWLASARTRAMQRQESVSTSATECKSSDTSRVSPTVSDALAAMEVVLNFAKRRGGFSNKHMEDAKALKVVLKQLKKGV